MTVLTLPDPCVVVLVGPAGAGKSTVANRLFRPAEILSSDALRARITGDETDQRANGVVFRALGQALDRRLEDGGRVVIDATNLRRADRRPWILAARRHGTPAIAIVLDLPAEDVRRQGLARQRLVATEVVDRHLAAMATLGAGAVGALRDEGFDVVLRLTSTAQVAELSLGDPLPGPDAGAQASGVRAGRTRPKGRARTSTHTPLRR